MLAIIIPYYKITFFEETLQSLANQSDKRFKVYIGDDASPENPMGIIEKYNGKFEYDYSQFQTNIGGISLVKQWERCIELTENEEWLMVLGDDDVLGKNVVKEFYNFIDSMGCKKIDLIRFNLKIIDGMGCLKSDEFIYDNHESSKKLLERMFSMKETITASEFIFSKRVYVQNNGFVEFPLAWFSDYATWLIFSIKSGVYNLSRESVYWRLSDTNISSKSVSLQETKLKVTSLFMFMSFLCDNFFIENIKRKEFVLAHLSNLLSNLKFFNIFRVLFKHLFRYNFEFTGIIVQKFFLKKIKKKYGYICTSSKR